MTFKDLFWPGFRWFVEPSGGPVPAGAGWWYRLYRFLYDAPLIAHPAGAWGVVGFMALGRASGFLLWWPVLLAEGINQGHKILRKVYGTNPMTVGREVVWRMAISAISTLPAWFWL